MSWTRGYWFVSAEEIDDELSGYASGTSFDGDSVTTRAATGSRCMYHRYDGTTYVHGQHLSTGTAAQRCWVLSANLGVSAAPSANITLASNLGSLPWLFINTNNKLEIRRASSPYTTLLESTSNISTTDLDHWLVVLDWLTGTANLRMWIAKDGTQEAYAAVTMNATEFFGTPGAAMTWLGNEIDANCGLYVDDMFMERTDTVGEAPYSTAYPILRGDGAAQATADGTYSGWDQTYAGIDEQSDHDGDSTYNETATNAAVHTYKSSDSNPIPSDATIYFVQMSMIERVLGAGKYGAKFYLIDSDSNEWAQGTSSIKATTFDDTRVVDVARPSGSWSYSDWAPNATEWGTKTPDTNAGNRVTMQPGPVAVYYNSSCDVLTIPSANEQHGSAWGQVIG